jgi:sugar-specific transcriptional regulator TrmB
MKNVNKGLKALGLTELEAVVYLKLLEMKSSRVTKLANAVKITRTQLYPLLEKMIEKGYVTKISHSPAVYSVVEPGKMTEKLEKWLTEQTKLVKEVQDFLKNAKK